MRAHTFDWYVPFEPAPWAHETIDVAQAYGISHTQPKTTGAQSVHLRVALDTEPLAAARRYRQPSPAQSYGQLTMHALTSSSAFDDQGNSVLEHAFADAERRHVRAEDITLDWAFQWKDGHLSVRLHGRPEDRSYQVIVVVQEAVQPGESFADPEWLHTPFEAELVNQITLVPQSFLEDERRALEASARAWRDFFRRFAESRKIGPGDPIAFAIEKATQLLRESQSTATLSQSLDVQFDALRRHHPEAWQSALRALSPPSRSDSA
jgi:hypothetical protein